MLSFCPFCGNILFLKEDKQCKLQLTCGTCPVFFPVRKTSTTRDYYRLKEIDDVRGNEALENADFTVVTCPKCTYDRAYFRQLQTRSADEPMTIFYRCCNQNCGHNWRD